MLEVILGNPILLALAALVGLAIAFGALLGFAAVRFEVEGNPLSDQINAILPQTQCGQCGYPGCRPYAEAIADGDSINKCPPGGEDTIQALANLTRFRRWPIYSTLNQSHWTRNTVSKPSPLLRISARKNASAAPNAFRPVPWMRS